MKYLERKKTNMFLLFLTFLQISKLYICNFLMATLVVRTVLGIPMSSFSLPGQQESMGAEQQRLPSPSSFF